MPNYASKVIRLALEEVGYLEKATNDQLDSKTANAGRNNYTKYARDLDSIKGFYNTPKNGHAWCDVFFDWLMVKAFGVEAAKKMLNQPDYSCGAGCLYSARYYSDSGRFHASNPKPGDQIFFLNSGGGIVHTGIVYKVDNKRVYTVEGNTSGASGVIANGGGVCKKSYYLNYNRIYGYGRPAYDAEPVVEKSYTLKMFVKDIQKAIGARVDGIAGPETLSKTVTLSSKNNSRHAAVKHVQKRLYELGYVEIGSADGVAGHKFTSAVAHFQIDNGCVVDGEITRGNLTWKKLLGLA